MTKSFTFINVIDWKQDNETKLSNTTKFLPLRPGLIYLLGFCETLLNLRWTKKSLKLVGGRGLIFASLNYCKNRVPKNSFKTKRANNFLFFKLMFVFCYKKVTAPILTRPNLLRICSVDKVRITKRLKKVQPVTKWMKLKRRRVNPIKDLKLEASKNTEKRLQHRGEKTRRRQRWSPLKVRKTVHVLKLKKLWLRE